MTKSIERFRELASQYKKVFIIAYNPKTEQFTSTYQGPRDIEKLLRHFETNKKVAIYSMRHPHYTMYAKNFITVGETHVNVMYINIFNQDPVYWSKHYMNFDAEHYPEYFL